MTIRTENIDGKHIHIIYDVFSQDEIEAFHEYVNELPIKRKEKSTAYDEFPIFSVDFDLVVFEKESYIGQKALELFQQQIAKAQHYQIDRSYINLSMYGDVEYPHFDCSVEKEDITILYYVNKNRHYKYGGETLFYTNKDSRIAVLPTPVRFVIFPGNIEHLGSVPTRIYKETHLSIVLKYKYI